MINEFVIFAVSLSIINFVFLISLIKSILKLADIISRIESTKKWSLSVQSVPI